MLFLGSFRHEPNRVALNWFLRDVFPIILNRRPGARLIVIGSDPPALHTLPDHGVAFELHGFVEDIREPLSRYSVFVCPILSGSGLRVKLLEAFASGMPAVSTRVGAEGLGTVDGELCALADTPEDFASRVVDLLEDPESAEAMAQRARAYLGAHRDMPDMARRLEESYRAALTSKAGSRPS